MHILIDVNHPGHMHFFKYAAWQWQARGHEVLVMPRDKDVTIDLVRAYGFPHVIGTTHRPGLVNLGLELLHRTALLVKASREFRPDVFLSLGSPAAAWASTLVRSPHIAFEDTEHSVEQYILYAPFTDIIYTPSCFARDLGHRQRRYNGYHELAYLHPNWFNPDPAILTELGLKTDEPLFVVRFVSWGASHDVGQRGFSDEGKSRLMEFLEERGQVILTSEAQASAELTERNVRVLPTQIHDLLYYATLCVGEGGTMATEAAVLGTPSVFVSSLSGGNWDELEHRYHLLLAFRDSRAALEQVRTLLASKDLKETWRVRRKRMLADKIDVSQFIVTEVERMALEREA